MTGRFHAHDARDAIEGGSRAREGGSMETSMGLIETVYGEKRRKRKGKVVS